ncbi:lysine--tRNA ligase [Candidatus Uhrbacteria bacterium]|nr:lysine--tRNA ligase [Candidatus Uhrbacteria bacterium]
MIQEEKDRLDRLEKLRAAQVDPYPTNVSRTHLANEALEHFSSLLEKKTNVCLVGRIRLLRKHGGLTFGQLQDASGTIQFALKKDVLGQEAYDFFHETTDVGDFLQVEGQVFLTKKGEKTVEAAQVRLVSKALLPLPEKWHGLSDVEARYRQRELDLLVSAQVRQRFVVRSKLISALRRGFDERGFLEVETPILQPIPGGANARPFITHHHALDADLYLRIAPELYLKRLIIGGFEKVYEIGRLFRNEGIDQAHNPEFTTIEAYWAFAEKEPFIQTLEEVLRQVIETATGGLRVSHEGTAIDFGAAWPRLTFREAVIQACGIDIDAVQTPEEVQRAASQAGLAIDFSRCVGIGETTDELFKKTARASIEQPTWILDYPTQLKPLARQRPDDPSKSASIQLIVKGQEIVNAYYHELNDPQEQRRRFVEQQTLREQGSDVAQYMDEDFLRALAHGMPPTSGVGIGIDRLVAFLTDAPNLKEIILFPMLRPVREDE